MILFHEVGRYRLKVYLATVTIELYRTFEMVYPLFLLWFINNIDSTLCLAITISHQQKASLLLLAQVDLHVSFGLKLIFHDIPSLNLNPHSLVELYQSCEPAALCHFMQYCPRTIDRLELNISFCLVSLKVKVTTKV